MTISITIAIIAVTVLASFASFNNEELNYKLSFSPYLVKQNNEWWRIFTHAFIHADHLHLFFNMYVFYNFGELIENTLKYLYGDFSGGLYYIGLYFGGILFATLPSLRKHSNNPSYRSVGASGAVSAVLFAFIMVYPKAPLSLILIPIPIPAYIMGALYLIFETYSNNNRNSNIAHDAHLAGAVFGILYMIVLNFDILPNFIAQIGF